VALHHVSQQVELSCITYVKDCSMRNLAHEVFDFFSDKMLLLMVET
jgi:hypothetical protein